jgi:hypothetical protein
MRPPVVHRCRVQSDATGAPHADRDRSEEAVGEFGLACIELRAREARQDGAHTTGNIEADTTSRDHAAFIGIEGRHATDGESVAPMGIRHRE